MSKTDTQAAAEAAPVEGTERSSQDTATQQPSEASELSKEPPEATQENLPSGGETEVKAEDTVAERLFAGKYKSVDDLEKSYKELESKYGQTANEKAELTRILNEAFVPPAANKTEDTEYYGSEEANTANPEIEEIRRDSAIVKFILAHNDADGELMKSVLAEDPMVSKISGYDAKLEYAYLRSQSIAQSKVLSDAKRQAQAEAHANMAAKEVARVEAASKAAPVDEGAELLAQATTGTPEERKAAREALIRKHLTKL